MPGCIKAECQRGWNVQRWECRESWLLLVECMIKAAKVSGDCYVHVGPKVGFLGERFVAFRALGNTVYAKQKKTAANRLRKKRQSAR